jgi:hypothetical protein
MSTITMRRSKREVGHYGVGGIHCGSGNLKIYLSEALYVGALSFTLAL